MLLHNEFEKIAKINELAGKTTFTHTEEINRLKESLQKARAELVLIKKNSPATSPFEQTKTIKLINDLTKQIRSVELERKSSVIESLNQLDNEEELTEDMLKAKLEYELVTQKIEKNFEELEAFTDCNFRLILVSDPVLLQEYADFLVQKQ